MGDSVIRCSSWFVEKNPSIYQTLIEDSVIEQYKDKSPDGVQTPLVAPMHHEGGGNTAQMVHRRTKSSSTDRDLFYFGDNDRLVYEASRVDISYIHDVEQVKYGQTIRGMSSFQTHLKEENHPEMFYTVLQP